MIAETPPAPRKKAELAALAAILAVAFAVRAWYGHFDPSPRRFFDEQFALENVANVLRRGDLRPAHIYHPSLSYLPQVVALGGLHLLAAATDQPALQVLGPGPRIHRGNRPAYYPFTPLAYRVGRLVQALIGTLAVALTFAIGRLLAGPSTGLFAAALAALAPQLVRQSALINEDAALVAAVLAAVWTAARAGAEPTWRRYLVAGVAVGLACAAKYNGVAAAIPLIAVTALRPREGKRWIRLVGAGAAAVVVFFLFNPFVLVEHERYLTDFGRTVGHYGKKSAMQGHTHAGVLVAAAATARDPAFLGPLTGGAALLGVALLLPAAAAAPRPDRRFTAAAVVAYAVGYPLVYALATRGVSRHNWLPLLPLLAVAAAYVVAAAADAVGRRTRRELVSRAITWAILVAAIAPLANVTYTWATPRTASAAGMLVAKRLGPGEGRIVATPEALGRLLRADRAGGLALVRLPLPKAGDLQRWQRVDALVARVEGPGGAALRRLAAATGTTSIEVPPRFGSLRGPPLQVLLLGWESTGERGALRLECTSGRRWAGAGAPPPGSHLSLALWLPHQATGGRALIGGQEVPLHWAGATRSRQLWYSEKVLRRGSGALAVELDSTCRPGRKVDATILGWRAARADATDPGEKLRAG